jgi:hypothetical protein
VRHLLDYLTIENLKEWQTLISGGLAIFAALLTGVFVWYQSQSSTRIEDRKRRSKFNAVRMTLALSLSTLMEWAEANILILNKIFLANGSSEKFSEAYRDAKLPAPLSPETIKHIQDVIEFGDDENLQSYLMSVLDQIQVIQSRLRRIKDPMYPHSRLNEIEILDHFEDSMVFLTWIEGLFSFARSEEDKAPSSPNWDRLPSQCFPLFRRNEKYSALRTRLAKKVEYEKGKALDREMKRSWLVNSRSKIRAFFKLR